MTTADRYNSIRKALEAERQRSSVIEMAQRRGISPGAMRSRLTYYGLEPVRGKVRDKVLAMVSEGIAPEEITSRLGLRPRSVEGILYRAGVKTSNTSRR